MRYLLLILITLALQATETQLYDLDICTTDHWNDSGKCVIVRYVDDSQQRLSKRCSRYSFEDDKCTDSSRLALDKSSYELLMGITANLLGFMLVFLVGFLFVLQGRR